MAKVEVLGKTKNPKERISKALSKAVEDRLKYLDDTIKKLKDAIEAFEAKYGMDTKTFYGNYISGGLEESMDYMEWRACKEILEDLISEKEALEEIKL